jgi:fimbrial chaperone protein
MLNRKIKCNLIAVIIGLGVITLWVPLSYAVIISPVQLDLSKKNPVGSFTVTNDSAATITYQAGALTWAQVEGEDIQLATNDLIVTPPIVTIKPKSAQVFRVALFKPAIHSVEHSYRIMLDDISADVAEKTETGISFRFNHNLPVFYAPATNIDSVIWSRCESKIAGKSCVLMENKGNRHAKVVKFTAISASAEEPNTKSKTLLAGSTTQWLFSSMLGSENTTGIKLITDKGPLSLSLKDLPRSR